MKDRLMLSVISAILLLGNGAYGYDEGASMPHTTKFGAGAGASNTESAQANAFTGYQSGYDNTDGDENVFNGFKSGYSNISGSFNVFTGSKSGWSNREGSYNTFVGGWSGYNNTEGDKNVFIGFESGQQNTTGNFNTFTGTSSGHNNTTGSYNTFIGNESGYHNIGERNTFIGYKSGYENSRGFRNTFIGVKSGYHNSIGLRNTFIGDLSGYNNSTGFNNIYIGSLSGYSNLHGHYNIFVGLWSGYSNTNAYYNTFVGNLSGYNADVNNSVFLGYRAGYNATRNNTLYIANSETNTPLIYGEFDTKRVKINGQLQSTRKMTASFRGRSNQNVVIMQELRVDNTKTGRRSDVALKLSNAKGHFGWSLRTEESSQGLVLSKAGSRANEMRLYNSTPDYGTSVILELANGAYCDGVWHDSSSRSMKQNIKDLDAKAAMEAFRKLRPVTYAYKGNPGDPKVGFIAEEVPDLVADPGRKSLSPMDMVALLAKVVQVQEKRIEEMKRELVELKKVKAKVTALETLLSNLALEERRGSERRVSLKP